MEFPPKIRQQKAVFRLEMAIEKAEILNKEEKENRLCNYVLLHARKKSRVTK